MGCTLYKNVFKIIYIKKNYKRIPLNVLVKIRLLLEEIHVPTLVYIFIYETEDIKMSV